MQLGPILRGERSEKHFLRHCDLRESLIVPNFNRWTRVSRVSRRTKGLPISDRRAPLTFCTRDESPHNAAPAPGRLPTIRQHTRFASLSLLWAAVVVYGSVRLMSHDLTPAVATVPPAAASSLNAIAEASNHFTLTMFVHPLCPCSRASVTELQRLLRSPGGRLEFRIYFVVAAGLETDPRETDLWKLAATLPNTTLAIDDNGQAADAFGATTSGQAYVFDGRKSLRFSGGLTSARGKTGETTGSLALLNLLQGETTATPIVSPVFGCSLR